MTLEEFGNTADLVSRKEVERVARLGFYLSEMNDQMNEFQVKEISEHLFKLGHAKPNQSRLKTKLEKSRDFIKGSKPDYFRLAVKTRIRLQAEFPNIKKSEEIVSDSSLIPDILFEETGRQYLVRIAKQINATYENHLFDACALMMRRLLEILLIHCFESCGIEEESKDKAGDYLNLKILINKAKQAKEINLSSAVKADIDGFRKKGNLSAHQITYNCRRDDIQPFRESYRSIIGELLDKCKFVS